MWVLLERIRSKGGGELAERRHIAITSVWAAWQPDQICDALGCFAWLQLYK